MEAVVEDDDTEEKARDPKGELTESLRDDETRKRKSLKTKQTDDVSA